MKVLVHFTQEFSSAGLVPIKLRENITKVFEVSSNEHLLHVFERYNEIPRHISKMLGKTALAGKKTMHWYLPENNDPFIKDDSKHALYSM